MTNEIVFNKDKDLIIFNKENLLDHINLFHQFILNTVESSVGIPEKSITKQAAKIINNNVNNLILSIFIFKQRDKDLKISYKLRSPNNIELVSFEQLYSKIEEIKEDLEYIVKEIEKS